MTVTVRLFPLRIAAAGVCIAVTVCIGAASAADLPSRLLPPPPAPEANSAFTWTGLYLGAHAGYAGGRDKVKDILTPTGAYTGSESAYATKGALAGIHGGANYQYGALVAGVVVDFEASGLRGGFNDAPVPPFNPGGISHSRVEGQGSLRGKLGAAYDRFLVYATGGLARGNLKYDYLNPSNGLSETTTAWHSGWTAGLGIEYAFTDHLSAFAEYRATRYGKFKYASRVAYAGFLTGEQQPRFNSAMVGVSYKY